PLIIRDPSLPAILQTDPFPLLLPAQVNPKHAVVTENLGLIGITHDRRLMRWTSAVRGAEQLALVPPGRVVGLFADEVQDRVHLVLIRPRQNRIDVLSVKLPAASQILRQYARN